MECGHFGIQKMVGKPMVLKKNQSQHKGTGDVTREYIEANREVLKEMKEETKNGHYE
jgi:uncharacterized protein YbbK (DUF523 family)